MAYATITLAEFLLRLEERYESAPYWTPDEGRYALNESLRVWNMLVAAWRKKETMAVAANAVWITLPGALSFAARAEWNGVPLEQTSLFDYDTGRPRWEGERTTSGSPVPPTPTHWAPAGVFRLALWPALGSGSGTLMVDGLRATPVLRGLSDTVDINTTDLRVLLGYALHYLAFKQGGKFWQSTRTYYQEFIAAALEQNARLRLSAYFRRMMGLDLDKDQRPIRRLPQPAEA